MHQHISNHYLFLKIIVTVVAAPVLFCSSAARAADEEAAKAAAHEAQEAAARVVAAAKAKATQDHLEGWEMGPFVKHPEPVLKPNPESVFDCPIMGKGLRWEEMNTYNPAAVVKDGKVYLFYRADGHNPECGWGRVCRIGLATSEDGIHFTEDKTTPPLFGQGDDEAYGIEDCRVAQIGKTYYLTFTKVSRNGVGVGLRSTTDWRTFTHHGMIIPPHNKDCALFEETIGGKYMALHRPSSPELGGNYIWLAESPDLEHWGRHHCIAQTRPGLWDSARIGAGAAPIRTDRGWLVIYHGADKNHRYCLGAMLLDLKNPSRVLARGQEPIMEPVAEIR